MQTKLLTPDVSIAKNEPSREGVVEFNFKSIEPDASTFVSRARHVFTLVNPRLYLASDKEVLDSVDLVKRYRNQSKLDPEGRIYVTE